MIVSPLLQIEMTASYLLPSIYTVFILLIAKTNCILSIDTERIFISGSADTTQIFHLLPKNSQVDNTPTTIKRHHHVCYQKLYTSIKDPKSISQEGRNKCCFELYQLGLLHRDDKQYCESHIALIPNLHHITEVGFGDAIPEYYLALDEQVTNSDTSIDIMKVYKQNRQLNIYEDKEKETLQDNLKTRGDNAYSPFHLTDFTSSGLDDSNDTDSIKSMYGDVEGILSSEGGMHRNFHQKLILSLDNISSNTCGNGAPSEEADSCEDSSSHQQININATVLLPIMESVFIDADDPLLVEYGNDSPPEGIACKVSLLDEEQKTKEVSSSSSSKCEIQFIHPEVIDIEQPSFASRQHVVAYQISASLDFVPPKEGDELKIAIDYGTTLHIRYPSPIGLNDEIGDNGLVPVVIQQPTLYSASAATINGDDDASNEEQRYRLQTDVTSPSFDETKSSIPPNPIVIHIAAGSDDDYWWITVGTMSSALIGGLVLMKSLDSVSIWN